MNDEYNNQQPVPGGQPPETSAPQQPDQTQQSENAQPAVHNTGMPEDNGYTAQASYTESQNAYTPQQPYAPPETSYTPHTSADPGGQPANGGFYTPPTPPPGGQHGAKTGVKIFCVALAAVLVITIGCGVGYLAGNRNGTGTGTTDGAGEDTGNSITFIEDKVPTADGITPDENGLYTAEQVSQLVMPSIVSITTYSSSGSSASISSGVIIDENGYVISNDHIYAEIPNARFVVTLYDNRSFAATFVAGDTRSDICVLKMEGASGLTPAAFGDSDELQAGEEVVAIGSPYGFSNSVTKGIVSTPNRRIQSTSTDYSGTTSTYSVRVIQTDAAINKGSSGGALVNMKGQVVGISSSKIVADTYEGMCFSIPANTAKAVASDLVQYGKVVGRARLGITYNEVSSVQAVVNDLPSGLMIHEISTESSLYTSGLKQGDIICAIDDQEIRVAADALDVIERKKAGDQVTLKVYVAASGGYVTQTATLLEDESTSSYSTEQPATSQLNPFKQQSGPPTTSAAD